MATELSLSKTRSPILIGQHCPVQRCNNSSMQGNIRCAEHFITFMKKIVEHLKARLHMISRPESGVTSEIPLAFLHRMVTTDMRLSSLVRRLQVPNLDGYNALIIVADFTSLVATYLEGILHFAVIMEPDVGSGGNCGPGNNPGIQLACLNLLVPCHWPL